MLAMCLIAGAGPGAQISLFHLSELFPVRQKSTVLSIVTGAFQLGFAVFWLWHLAFTDLGLDLATLSMLYCVPLTVLLLLGGVLWPDAPCIPPEDTDPLSFTSRDPTVHTTDDHGVAVYSKLGHSRISSHSEAQVRSEEEGSEAEPLYDAEALSAAGVGGSRNDEPGSESRTSSVGSAAELPIPDAEQQPLMRNLSTEHTAGSRGLDTSPVDYGSLPDPHSSPSLHYIHRNLHALKVSRSQPNLKGMTHGHPFLMQLFSPSFLLCLLWMCICIFWANFYVSQREERRTDKICAADAHALYGLSSLLSIPFRLARLLSNCTCDP
jgi:hypothetical protein